MWSFLKYRVFEGINKIPEMHRLNLNFFSKSAKFISWHIYVSFQKRFYIWRDFAHVHNLNNEFGLDSCEYQATLMSSDTDERLSRSPIIYIKFLYMRATVLEVFDI